MPTPTAIHGCGSRSARATANAWCRCTPKQQTNFFKTELELGHCLRLPQEGPCECDLYLRCSKFFTTSEYAPRLRARLACEQQLIQDATEHGWPRAVERHEIVVAPIHEPLTQLGEDTQPDIAETCH